MYINTNNILHVRYDIFQMCNNTYASQTNYLKQSISKRVNLF